MRAAVLLTLPLLTGCEGILGLADLLEDDPELTVTVWNQGAQQVRVHMIVRNTWDDRRDENFLLDPGQAATFDYADVTGLEVRAWRTSDSVEIFREIWSPKRHENVYLYP